MAPVASKLAAKKKKGGDDVDPTLKCIAALFELEKAIQDGTLTPNDERLAQTEFWSAMRSTLAVNELTSGVEILGVIAAALISGQADPLLAFSGPINLLPPPSRQRAGGKAPMHPAFSTGEKRPSSVAGATGKTPKPPKKQKLTLPNPPPIEPPPTRAASMIDFELSPRAPVPLREDLEVLYVKASAHGVTVYVMAYPWVEIQLCEDLGEMCRRSKFEYKTRIHSALTPGRLDKNAYKNMTSLLVLSGALNPACKKPENRLSDMALARLRDSTYEIPSATAFDPKEATKSGYDPFKKADGSYTVLAPDEGLPVDYDDVVAAQGDDDATSETVDEVIDMTGDQSEVVEGIPSGNNNDESSDSSSTASLLRKVNEKTPKTESK
ncbi:hypothetical protein PF010_g23785 [Phytophthora fragariae]|uniref:Uncharacterized protein n=3 Tax=Phytophthora fragariae TaxID=53985 RepID=A0A6A3WR54_9STRA|nr:hypothetical protein PF011_g26523 [Phytophthora fragariae]KAE9076734.1 hypothetical protein PF010_g23785 [Phytophthora fragariae]KAE9189355.1 hypothetical protein PF002_g25070 [Phytophthora fragariae]